MPDETHIAGSGTYLDCRKVAVFVEGGHYVHQNAINVGSDMDGTYADFECPDCGTAFRVLVT